MLCKIFNIEHIDGSVVYFDDFFDAFAFYCAQEHKTYCEPFVVNTGEYQIENSELVYEISDILDLSTFTLETLLWAGYDTVIFSEIEKTVELLPWP